MTAASRWLDRRVRRCDPAANEAADVEPGAVTRLWFDLRMPAA